MIRVDEIHMYRFIFSSMDSRNEEVRIGRSFVGQFDLSKINTGRGKEKPSNRLATSCYC